MMNSIPPPTDTELSKLAESKRLKNKEAQQGCLGCLGLLFIGLIATLIFSKCSSGGNDSTAASGNKETKAKFERGKPELACPYEIEGNDQSVGSQTIWIVSKSAETPEQRAATVFVAGQKLLSDGKVSGDIDIVLAIAPDLAGKIPNALYGLYVARASYRTGSWKVYASKHPRTPNNIETLRAIYGAAKERHLNNETDYIKFLVEQEQLSQDDAYDKVWKAIDLGTPSIGFDFK